VEHLTGLVAKAAVLYVSTDLDDLFVLVVFFSDSRFRTRQIATGQFVGIALLFVVSVGCSLISFLVPQSYVGLLGLAPIAIGIKKSWNLLNDVEPDEEDYDDRRTNSGSRANVVTVAAVTAANGGDNLSVYIPLFASRSAYEIVVIGVTFTVMTAVWLGLAHWLTRHRAISLIIRRYERFVVPVALIALGAFILYSSGTMGILRM